MSMIAQEYAEETKKLLKHDSNDVDWNFAFVIYVYDEDNDTNLVEIDSVWTNETEALQRMMKLEKMENAILERSDCVKYSYRYKLRGYSEKFPFADGTNIMRENPDGTVHDWKYGIVCKRVPLNVKTLLKPFNMANIRH